MRLVHIAPIFLFLFGCVLSNPASRNSRFSVDITKMKKYDELADTWIYQHPTKKITDYKRFIITPVSLYENTTHRIKKNDRLIYDDEALAFTNKIVSTMKKSYTLVDNAGATTLRINVSIVDIKPIVELKRPDGNIATVTDTTLKGTKFEVDCYDSVSNEEIFAVSTLYKGESYTAYLDPGFLPYVEAAFNKWSQFFKERLDQAMKESSPK